jgi:O-antigen/teichoic acid export membrane protein
MNKLLNFLQTALKHKINRDIMWTLGSFFILAASGVIMNIIIVIFRDSASLGIFNLSYAVYLIGSQVAVIGIHNSVMRYAAYHSENLAERGAMLASAIAISLFFGITLGAVIYLAEPLLATIFSSAEAGKAIAYTGFGLMLFPLNKVLIAYINGLRHMRALSLLQTTRYLTVLVGITIISISTLSFTLATWSFFIAEALTTISVLIYMGKAGLLKHLRVARNWVAEHLAFGVKGALGSILLDMNTRVDVLLLGVFLSEREVGIYSFAAMVIDGLQHILSMLRVNFNPILVTALRDKDWKQASQLLHYSKIYVFLGTLTLALLVIPAFYLFVEHFIANKGLLEGWKVLAVLFGSYVLISGFTPFDNLLLASGHPAYQTMQNMSVALVNIVLCFLLIPKLGIMGAAISTAFSYIVGIAIMLVLSYVLLGWNLLSNTTPETKAEK